jgi:twinkle protein
VTIKQIHDDVVDLYQNGIQKGKEVGNHEIDQYCTWELGRLCVCTAIPGAGKSEFIDYIVAKLNNLYGWKAAYFTPENYPLKFHYAKMHEKISGRKYMKDDIDDFYSVYDYLSNNFYYILDEDDLSIEKVIQITKHYIKKFGIKILVIDPYNVLDHRMPSNVTETQYISDFLGKLITFTRFNNILTFLVAHPRKMLKGDIPTLYDISGSAHFYNKTDYGFTVNRIRDENNIMTNELEIHWQKIKFKHLGSQGVSNLMYNYNNGRFEQEKDVNQWDNTNWLLDTKKYINFHDEIDEDNMPF